MRQKIFGLAPARSLDREGKVKLMARARALCRRRLISRAALAVCEALTFAFGKDGRRFPSLTTLAAKAGVARSTAALAIKVLEQLGILTWAHRLRKDHDGTRWRVFRNSNAYVLAGSAPEQLLSPMIGTNRDQEVNNPGLLASLDWLLRGVGAASRPLAG
jgi:DNA-binding transcriptional MocR family regulator